MKPTTVLFDGAITMEFHGSTLIVGYENGKEFIVGCNKPFIPSWPEGCTVKLHLPDGTVIELNE